jgi:ankyrin repeat protein
MLGLMKIKILLLLIIISKWLIAENIFSPNKIHEDLFDAINNNNITQINYNLNTIEDINYHDSKGNNALIYAVQKRNIDLVKAIIKKGININHQNFNNSTALHEACKVSDYKIVQVLLENKIQVRKKDIYGNDALYYAKLVNSSNIINLLIHYIKVEKKVLQNKNEESFEGFIDNFHIEPINEI